MAPPAHLGSFDVAHGDVCVVTRSTDASSEVRLEVHGTRPTARPWVLVVVVGLVVPALLFAVHLFLATMMPTSVIAYSIRGAPCCTVPLCLLAAWWFFRFRHRPEQVTVLEARLGPESVVDGEPRGRFEGVELNEVNGELLIRMERGTASIALTPETDAAGLVALLEEQVPSREST